MYVKLLTNNFLSEKAVGKSESKDVHLAVLRVLPEVIRESVDAERHADYRKGEGGKGTEGERRDAGRIVAVNQGKRDGSGVDADASSKSVIIYDPATGEKKMVSPTAVDGIESLGEVKTAEQREAEINAHMQDTIQRSKDWLEGNVANPVGMQIQLGDGRIATIEAMHEDGKSAIATLPDGTQFLVPNDVLQMIVNYWQYADYKARRDAEASKREAEQSTESAPETATEGGQSLPEEASPKEESREYAQGDVFDVVVDGNKMHAEIVSPKDADGRFVVNVDDGESMRTLYVTPEELAAMEYRKDPSPKAEETRLATEDSSDKAFERGAQPTEEHTPTALERIPRDEKGNAQFHDVDTETAWDGLVEMSGNEETAHKVAEASLANAERKLKAAKALKEKGETPEELLQSIKENEAAVAEAQRVVDAWKAIVGEKARREEAAKAEAERIATEKAEAERKAAEERERAEKEEKTRIEAEKKEAERIAAEKAEEEARVEAERKAEEERIAKQKAEEKTAEAESDKEEAEKRMDDEEPKPVGSGVFGNIYNQFKGKVKEAFDFLMKHKGGDLLGVFHRKDVGDIDLVWGDHGGGLAHIIRRHIIEQNDFKNVDEIQKVIEDVIRNGLIVRENKDKINIEYNGYRVSIKKTIRDSKGNVVENKNWIVTAFDKSKPKHEKRNPSSSETLTTPSANQKADGVTLPSNEDSTDKGSKKTEKKQEKQSVFDKAKEIADKEVKKRKAEAEKQKVDKHGNPIDAEGRLITEKVEDISDLSDDDFNNPTRSVELPKIPKNVDDALGANGRPVIIKKNIFEKNGKSHGFTPKQSRKILGDALYNPDIVGQSQPSIKKTHWVAIKVDEKSPITILEVNDGKDNVEVVGWYTLDARNLERIKRQAEREGGELLVLSPKDKVESLPTPTSGLPTDKGSEVGGEKQEAEKKRPVPIAERIEDVGEKIGDARKDVWKEIIARIKNKKQGIEEALKKSSAGKLFSSLFDEKELLESGVSNEVVTFISAVKGSLGTKPRSLSKLKMWINKVLHQYDMCEQALENWESVKKKIDEWKYYSQPFYMYRAAMAVGGYESGRDVGNAELWQIADGYSDGKSVAGQWCVRKAGAYDGIYKTYEEAAEALKKFAGENAAIDGKGKRKEVKLAIYKRRTDGTMFIAPEGKPDVIIQDGFKTLYEASAYKKEHYAEMQERYRTLMDGIKPKFNENRERKGRDWRGGKDVSAEDFREAFDFRGVEFGNWMQQKDRRQALNECYDSLMDLAMVCGVSPKALSLGGKLAMAFGARGGGKFNAHYEPDKVVINLTKTKGAGSLAHEWFHAIDNYFNMQGWDEFATESTRNVERKEMAEAWKDLVRAINGSDYFKRSDKYARLKGSRYWIEPTELGARAFAVWVENRLSKYGTINDYLANNPRLVDEKASDAEKKYAPYPFDKDADWMDEKFGRLFEVMQERVDEETGKHILYSRNKAAGHEKTELTEEERELRDNLVERMRKGGLDVVTDSEEMQRVIDTENERTRNKRSKKSEAARKRDEALYAVDWSTAFVSGKSREEATEIRRERGRKFKEETKELYGRVLSGNFDDVTLRLIDEFIDKSTPNNPYERPISKRLPTRALQKMRGGERTGSVDALFSRICESTVGKDGKTLPRAERERAIEEKKKELLKKWAIATGNWHTDVSDFSDGKEPIGSGTDSDVYLSKDGKSVIKVSKGKPYGKRFRPDVDNVALFNSVFRNSAYTIVGYGEVDGKFVRFLKQPIVDFTSSTPLTEGERVAYMEKLGFKPINKENTAFSNGEIIASDLQKSNIVKDKQGNVRVIDADMKFHTKDFGGKFSYPDAETDTRTDGVQRFLRTADGEVYGLVKDGRIYLDPKVATAETAVHEYTHLWGDMLRRKDSEQWSHTVKELKNSVLWEEVKESYPELKTDDEIADEVLSTFSGRRGAERLREEARRVAEGDGGVFTKAKAIETLERVKEAIARFWEGVARMFGINRYRSAEELADMAMRDLINGVKPTSRTFTFDNFYKDTKAVFEGTERPKGKPDYTSYSGSEYWYGEDKGGKYVVRGSDHWSGEFKVKDGERTNVGRNHYSEITEDGMLPIGAQGSLKFGWEKGLSKPVGSGISAAIDRRGSGDSNNIASCYWYIDNAKEKDNKGFTYGKAYLSEFEDKERRRDIPGDDWRDIQGVEGGTRAMAERIAEQPVEEINNRFNEELEKYQNNELPKGHRFELGMPSAELQSAGFPTLPISMRSSLLAKKAGAERHPFAPTDLRDLVNAIQKPIAIFNYSKNNMRNLIVDVSRGGKHFLVGVTLNYKADNIEINSVSGLFPKENHEWIKWIQDGKVLRIDQKEKVQDLINSLRTNPAESERIGLNLDNVAKKVKDFENPKLFDGKISEVDKKGSDSIDSSVRENPKNEDKPRFSRKPGESIFDYASRVSEDVDRSVRERVSARDEYEKKVKSKGFQTKEALQNSMLGLQEFMSAIDHASGNKRYIEDIPDFENPILGENRLSSVNKEEMHQVAKTQFKPLMSAVAKLSGNGKESGELYDYMFAKHGLERDAVMRQREAQKEFDKYQKANPKGTKTIGDFVASLEGKDYAGLTALTSEDGRVKSIQSQIDAIDEQMEATDDQLLLRKLGGQKKRLKVDLLNAARDAADDIRKTFESNPSHDWSDINELWKRVNEVNGNTLRKLYESGMLTKEAYNDISSMYTNYIPMRGFDQTTSADAYAYLTHGDSAFNAPIKTAKGRSSKADNPIAYMQAMAESAIMQGNRNVLVKQKMLNFVRNHPSDLASVSDVWLQYDSVADEWKPVFPDNIGANDSASVVAKKMEAFEDKMKQMAEKHPDLVQRSNEAPDIPYKVVEKGQLNEHQVLVKQNGKSYIITVNGSPRAAQAANGLTNPDTDLTGAVGKVFEGAEALNRQLSSLYTTLNPDFIGSNYVRDALYSNTMVYVKEGAKYGGSFNLNFAKYNPAEMANLYARYNKGSLDTSNETHRLFLEFMQNGGETGFVNLKQIEKRKSEIAKAIKRDGRISAAQIWGGLSDAVDFANRAVENSARFAAYVTSRKSGRSVGRSVYDAKEISVNFNRKGSGRNWWKDNVGTSRFYDTEIGLVEINRASVGSSLAHRYSQVKLDVITSLAEGFNNAVYFGSMQDFSRQEGVKSHYFAYPINYNGNRNYVFCRAMQDANKSRLYVHEVFLADNIEKGNTLQTAASQPHGGITLYKDILANVLAANVTNDSETSKPCFSRKPGESIFDYASRVSEDVDRSVCEGR